MRARKINNKGIALVTVVLFFLVLVILLGGVMFSSVSNQKNAMLSKDHTAAYYSAESGMNIAIEKLVSYLESNGYSNITNGYTTKMLLLHDFILSLNTYSSNGLDDQTGILTGISPTGTYTISTDGSDYLYTIQSTGQVNDTYRTLVTTLKIDPILIEQAKAILTKGTIDVKNSTIIGPIASLFDLPGSYIDISCNGSTNTVINEFFVPVGTDIDSVSFGSCDAPKFVDAKPVPEDVVFKDVKLPDYFNSSTLKTVSLVGDTYTLNLSEKGVNGFYIPSLPTTNVKFNLVGGSQTTEFDLYVGSVNISSFSNVGDIEVLGLGKLRLMVEIDPVFKNQGNRVVEEEANFNWNGYVNVSSLSDAKAQLDKFQLIIKSSPVLYDISDELFTIVPTFSISNSGKFVGSIIMDRINVDIGNVEFKGFIATQGDLVKITSTSDITGPMWIYAPNANFIAQTPILIEGSIISSTATFSAGGTLKYEQYTGEIPSLIDIPEFSGGAPVPVGITVDFINFKEIS